MFRVSTLECGLRINNGFSWCIRQGIHYGLGAPLARLEGEIAFATLLKRMPNIRLDIAPEALEWRPAFELRGLKALPVLF